MATFADLGASFPLFEAPIDDADDVHEDVECSLCGRAAPIGFDLDIGCAVMLPCGACGAVNGLDASDAADVDCHACGASIAFPALSGPITACHGCLRAGRAAITKDSELGMISWEQARAGVTHGAPGLSHPDFEMVPTDSDWVRARIAPAIMSELIRTPTYTTIQGERWLFCCKQPMIFVGAYDQDRFDREAPAGQGRAWFEQVVEDVPPGLWEDIDCDHVGVYMFRCAACGRRRGHWDAM